ncbi:MAG TPA: histidinol-phosphate transaminase [Nitrososphaeraceae archaeon]|jgi:threonine-phosphate decarboxylase|nr:histidinol-phosphate transaminase [Nitrososphaeraceae archaeon]
MNQFSCSHGGVYTVNPSLVRVDFSSNINPLGISKKVLNALRKNLPKLSSIYPDNEHTLLKKKIVDYLGSSLSPESINIGNGATELIYNFVRTLVRNQVVIPSPTFCEYELASRKMGAKISHAPLKNWKLDIERILEKSKNSDAIFFCNPNNPTGLYSYDLIEGLIERADESIKILIDESFIEFVDDSKRPKTFIEKINEFQNIVVLRSMTKSFGLAGLRLGYCVSHPSTARKISHNKITWNVNGLAQLAGVTALENPSHVRRARKIIKSEREFMYAEINNKLSSFSAYESDVNYYLIQLHDGNSTQISDTLLQKNGILVRDCSDFKGINDKYIRVAVKTRDENLKLLHALESIDK